MKKSSAPILWFSEIHKDDIPLVGGKGANLGEMTNAGIPVPNGFVVTSKAYFDFVNSTSLKQKILTELSGLNTEDSAALMRASENIKTAILAARMPDSLVSQIRSYYHELSGNSDRYVAVRSSATAEDLPDASFAGQQETYLNIIGFEAVCEHVQKCWASLFESRAIFYRVEQGYDHLKVGIAVPVQLMVQSEVSGIMFTVNPLTNNLHEISIEAAFGLGQPIVSGEVTPDQFIVSKNNYKILSSHISIQTWQLTLAGKTPISRAYQHEQKLDDKHVIELAKLGHLIEKHYGHPQDIEWAFEDGRLLIVQSRPVTTLNKKVHTEEHVDKVHAGKYLLQGLGASPGVASGPVKILNDASEITKVKEGDVLVAVMTNPDFVPAMKRACAIVTDEGGRTSHAAIVSRELGIPAIVGSQMATKILKTGEVITVDGFEGKVYEGSHIVTEEVESIVPEVDFSTLKTATNVYVNLAEPELAGEIAARNVDGVGLLRAEFMIAQIGTHPKKFIEDGRGKEFTKKLVDGLETFARAFYPRPVIYRTTDFRSNEYKGLKGGAKYELDEPNPMIGYRGAGRYLVDDDVFNLEIEAIKQVRNVIGLKNLHVMIPFVRTVDQWKEVKRMLSAQGLRRSGNFKLYMMVEVPSTAIILEEFIKEGLDGVSIGSNDLTMLVLGVDRDNAKVANIYNELDPAVLWCLERIVTTSKKHGVTCSICGQAPSVYPELVDKLVEWGVTSVSVSPDVLEKTRQIVYESEKRVLKTAGARKSVQRRSPVKKLTKKTPKSNTTKVKSKAKSRKNK